MDAMRKAKGGIGLRGVRSARSAANLYDVAVLPFNPPTKRTPTVPSLPRPALFVAMTALSAALWPAAASAQWTKQGEETLSFKVGAVSQNFDTTVRVDGSVLGGTGINLERDVGLIGDKTTYQLQAAWRVASRHRLDAFYSDVSRSASRATDRTLVIGNVTVPIGTLLFAEQKTAVGYLGYRYSLMKSQGAEVAAGIGAYGGNLEARFSASSPFLKTDQSTTVPLPVLVLSADTYLSDRLSLSATIRGLKVEVNRVNGQVLSLGAALEYLVTNNVGVGVSFERFGVSVDSRKANLNGELEVESTSGRLYLTARF